MSNGSVGGGRIDLDHAAGTPMLPAAVRALVDALSLNANSTGAHGPARQARRLVEDARDELALWLGVDRDEVVLCSGGTEADNAVIAGAPAGPALCSAVEHPAVLESMARRGGTVAPVLADGRLDLARFAELLTSHHPVLVSVMAVNNEVGVVQPVAEATALVRELAPDALVHCDAVQAMPWIDPSPIANAVDAIALSAHKFGGPQGIGAYTLRGRAASIVSPRQLGGGQERDRRSGTHPVAAISAMGVAAAEVRARRERTAPAVAARRDRLVDALLSSLDGVVETAVTGVAPDRSHKVAGNAHVCIDGIESEAVLFALDEAGLAASAASSCASGAQQGSHVLSAMGVGPECARGALRLTLGWTTTDDEVDRAAGVIVEVVRRLRLRTRRTTGSVA